MLKKVIAMLLTSVMVLSGTVVSFAEDKIIEIPYCDSGETMSIPVGDAEYIKDQDGNIIAISDLMSFESKEDAEVYIENVFNGMTTNASEIIMDTNNARATSGDVVVDSESVGLGTIKLRVVYETSGNSNTGTITYSDAYTSFTGYTLGFGWDERTCYARISSSGRDIYAYTAGDLTYNFLIDGMIELGRKSVSLSGTVGVIR